MKSIAIVAAASVLFAPGVSLAQKGEARPDFNLDPNYGTVDLSVGFEPDPYTKAIRAGGSIPASRAKSGCEGNVSAAPDFQVTYEAGALDLTFKAVASEDTTLLVNTPGGDWYCDDDSGGDLDPEVTIDAPQSGRYDIWVGTYGDSMVDSTLSVTERVGMDGDDSGSGPDISLEPNYGTANLRGGFTPDPWIKSILAGGSSPASAAKSGCEGSVSAAPDIQIFFEPGDSDLTFRVRAEEDTTLLINTPNGRFYCDDDSGGDLDPKVTITNPQSGRYDIWVGTYNDSMVQSTLEVSEMD